MWELDSKDIGAILVTIITSLGTLLVGMRAGRAQFITAVHQAADQVIERLEHEIERVSLRADKCDEAHEKCKEELRSFRNEFYERMREPVAGYEILDRPRLTDRGDRDES